VINRNLGEEDSILKGFSNIYNTLEEVEFMRDYSSIDSKK